MWFFRGSGFVRVRATRGVGSRGLFAQKTEPTAGKRRPEKMWGPPRATLAVAGASGRGGGQGGAHAGGAAGEGARPKGFSVGRGRAKPIPIQRKGGGGGGPGPM